MAALNLDGLDDPILIDACTGFGGGQRSYGPPDQLQLSEAARLENIDVRDGTAATRRGTEDLPGLAALTIGAAVQGLFWYDTPAREYLVAAVGGSLWQWDESAWSSCSSYTAASATAPVCFTQLIDKLYVADGASHLFSWDGAALVDLGTGGATQPPIGSILISAQNRLWLAGLAAVPDALCASAIIDGATWNDTTLQIRIGGGEGDPITGLAEWDDYQIVVFKRNSIYIVRADPSLTHGADPDHSLANATVTKISDTIGCVSHRSIARVGGDLWFLSDGGVFSLGRVLAQTQRELKPAASLPVQDVIDRIHWASASQAAAVFWNHRYLLSLPLDDDSAATGPRTVLVYHAQREAWSGTWTGWGPLCWAVSKAHGDERLNFGRADGAVWRWLDYVPVGNEVEATFQDGGSASAGGAAVPSLLETRAMIFGDPVCRKSALSVQAEFFGSRAMATVSARLDEGPAVPLKEVSTDPGELLLAFTLPATLPGAGVKRRSFGAQHLSPFRSLQAVVACPAGKLVVRAIITSGFGNTITLEE
jgi:hypothetical protein